MNAPLAKAKSVAKTISPLKEAERLRSALAKVDAREHVYVSNAATRYQAERNALIAAASPAALRVLEAASSVVEG
jgi:hypothetical protein